MNSLEQAINHLKDVIETLPSEYQGKISYAVGLLEAIKLQDAGLTPIQTTLQSKRDQPLPGLPQ